MKTVIQATSLFLTINCKTKIFKKNFKIYTLFLLPLENKLLEYNQTTEMVQN